MKGLYVRQAGALATGAVMLSAALAGAVSAGLDDTGLTKSFFYDAAYNPVVQVVVGEKGMATDAVAAGNIAATVGNLAYASKATTVGAEGSASGQVSIGVSAIGATGKFKQATEAALTGIYTDLDTNGADFYHDDDVGLIFSFNGATFGTSPEKFERGEFISYSLACDTQERSEAGVLKEGEYTNVHCLFCQTLCLSSLENPSHEIKESITVDGSKIGYLETGMNKDDAEYLVLGLLKDTLSYTVEAGEIPISSTIKDSMGDTIDFEWRGKMILFGEEYYVKDIKGVDKIYLAKGAVLDDISSEGYTAEYMGYKFKVDHLIYSAEYQVAGILLDVEKPDGTVVQTQISKMANGIVDDIEISGVYAEEADQVATASILVYDTTTNVLLEDGRDIELGGQVKKYWRVDFATRAVAASNDVTEYDGGTGTVLENITIRYRQKAGLVEGMSLPFPATYKLTFDGFRSNDFRRVAASGEGEGNIKIEKDGMYQLLISFTDDGGNRWDNIRMDQGPFSKGDRFILGGKVFEYDDSEEKTTTGGNDYIRLTFKDLVDGGRESFNVLPVTSPGVFYLNTSAFEEASENDDSFKIETDTNANDTDVFIGRESVSSITNGMPVLYDSGDIYFVVSNNASVLNNTPIGVNATQVGTITKFQATDVNSLQVYVVNEAGTNINDPATFSRLDTDDTLVVIKNNRDAEYVIVDMYDRNYDDATDVYYGETVHVDTGVDDTPLWRIYRDVDTVLYLPGGGHRIDIDWGGDYSIDGIQIMHPQEAVAATYFVGTSEESTVIESVITEADVGTTKTAGCCTFTVEEFGVSGAQAASVTETTMRDLPANLVVPEISADASKNLIIVGGPAVNGMSTVTAEQIAAASKKYLVKKDGRKLIVAGWTASDTVDAGNALIDWLKANVH
ncbi:MAG: S-layer protein [Candidatus Altiarchaeota archaeon]